MRGVLSADETTVTRLGKVIPKVPALSLKRRRATEKKQPKSFTFGGGYERNNEGRNNPFTEDHSKARLRDDACFCPMRSRGIARCLVTHCINSNLHKEIYA